MKSLLQKAVCCLLLLAFILASIATVSPLALKSPQPDHERGNDCVSDFELIALSLLELESGNAFLRPEAAQESTAVFHKRSLETPVLLPEAVIWAAEIKSLVELNHFVLDNELHFNLPTIIYRQSSSDHATEG